MARGGKRLNKNGNSKRFHKFKKINNKKKTPAYRDIKHTSQYKEAKVPVRNTRPEPIDEPDEIPEVEPLQQLLATFSNTNVAVDTAIDSEDESSEKSQEEDTTDSVSEDDSILDYMDDDDDDDNEHEEHDQNLTDSIPNNGSDGIITNNDGKDDGHDAEEQEEEEEENEEKIDTDDDDDDDEIETEEDTALDPFHQHLFYDIHESVVENISASTQNVTTHSVYWPMLHNLKVEVPKTHSVTCNTSLISLDKEKPFAKEYSVPTVIQAVDLSKLHIKTQLHGNILKLTDKEILSPFQKEIFSIINNYQDLYFPEARFDKAEDLRFVYCLHAVNHVLKTRLKIIHHNERLVQKSKQEVPDEFRDQGLVRPKVLFLVPFRESCRRIVKTIASILLDDRKANIVNKSRFLEEFSGSELALPKKNPKPEDYEQVFKGNIDDTFRIGLSVTKKSLKLYSEFYSSDIIIASPLGLRMVIGAEGDKERDFDFLASIELLVMDQSEVFLMQNWDHLLHVFDHMHVQPRDSHGTDFSRVRSWALNGWTKYYRQSIILSSINTPELTALVSRKCYNYAGRVRVANTVDTGTISQVVVQVPQVFQRFHSVTVVESLDSRFQHFVEKILPQFKDPIMIGVLIYVPSYFDYVRIRNYMKKEDYNFVQICEYSKEGKVARARDMFYHNETRFLLYSERFHFFNRITLKGIRHIIFYQPPTFPHFYSEILNLTQDGNQNRFVRNDSNSSATVLYCKYDIHALAAIVKTTRASRMVASDKPVHMFATSSD